MSSTRPWIRRAAGGGGGRDPVFRWQCRCQDPPVLLATYDAEGRVNIKVRDRYWHVHGQVQTICPRCGAEHVLDLRRTERHGRRWALGDSGQWVASWVVAADSGAHRAS
jgi:hypothetical protein